MQQFNKYNFFYTTLILPKIKFKLNNFFNNNKNWNLYKSFWLSLGWFSHELSSFTKIWILTLKKIKNKIFLKNFFLTLLSTSNWISFSETDIINKFDWNSFSIKKKIKSTDINSLLFKVFTTNKIFNKIFWNFLFIVSKPKSSFFMEKYFFTEKSTRALGITNNLKYLFIKFFSFYLSNLWVLKKLFFKLKNNFFSNVLKKLINYSNLFLGKRYFIFFLEEGGNFNFPLLLKKIFIEIELLDCTIFSIGKFFLKSEQLTLFSTVNTKLLDLTFINFFLINTVWKTYLTNKYFFSSTFTKKTLNSFINYFSNSLLLTKKLYLNILFIAILQFLVFNLSIIFVHLQKLFLQLNLKKKCLLLDN